ncbi:VanZ family protein [Poritiphilus flavus]|uniref:VanZ-like domain-containing protein n=1 Tax=Poritiphilus flavus TaxID=2697053 RepID=A0A6L9EGM4_9FLAO|nr:VanZ family protein [Poritiphilus flavus]NAS13782.1 hypothetical protein [Poritiphilus flavus]
MLRKYGYTLFFAGWMILITVLSLVSFSSLDSPKLDIPYIDKVVHFSFYCVSTFLGCLFLRELTGGKIKMSKGIFLMVFVLVLYGMIIEVVQEAFTDERSMEFSDALANTLGAITGGVIINYLFSGKRQLKWKI